MGNLYKFETDQFGVSDNSIHLLRNKFNYKSIDFNNIDSIKIQKGKDLKNWFWVFVFGFGLMVYVAFDIMHIFYLFTDNQTSVIYIERLMIPLLPCALGIYSLIISLRVTKVMIIQCREKSYYLSLDKFIKSNEYNDLTKAIKEKCPLTKIID